MSNTRPNFKVVVRPSVARKLLQQNPTEIKFCPYCGTPVATGCECGANFIVDIKASRTAPEKSVFVFARNAKFDAAFAKYEEEARANDRAAE